MKTHVYIDGFALYHMCYRGERNLGNRAHTWLDLRALSEALFPDDDIALIRYYTARVGDTAQDRSRASRQDVYLRALRTLPGLDICQGQFQRNKREGVLVHPPPGVQARQTVWVVQEKRSDVSLATHLLMDALDDRFETAVLITNDSDFVEPIRIVRERFGKRVTVVSPDDKVGKRLGRTATAARILDRRLLPLCQLPPVVVDADGRHIRCPAPWTPDDVAHP